MTPDRAQMSIFDILPPPPERPRNLTRIRARLAAMLLAVQEADRMPWDAQTEGVNGLLIDNMSKWLPDDERAALRDAYWREVARLTGPAR